MKAHSSSHYKRLMSAGLLIALIFVYIEIQALLVVDQRWDRLLAPTGLVTAILYIGMFFLGGIVLAFNLWQPDFIGKLAAKLEKLAWLRWLVVAGLYLFIVWANLYSSWQSALPGPWTQFIFAAGLTCIVGWSLAPQRDFPFGWSELALAFGIFLYPRIVLETRMLASLAIVYRSVTVIGYFIILLLTVLLYHQFGQRLRDRLLDLRLSLHQIRWLILPLFWLLPFLYRYAVGAETYILYPNLRFGVFLVALWVAAFALSTGAGRLVRVEALGLTTGVLVLVSFLNQSLLLVVDDPFSLTWSEGNRFYDYSLVFAQYLYEYPGTIVNPYGSIGRYALWGILFLSEGLPIWAHRLWNIFLVTAPSLLLAVFLTKPFKGRPLRSGLFLGITIFFIVLAPLHPPFMLASIIVAAFSFDPSPVKRGASLAVASFYAGLSRWTWAFAPAALGVLVDLLIYYPQRKGTWWRKVIPTVILALSGLIPGLLPSMRQYIAVTSGQSLAANQPLLWYRLLPNETLGPGVLLLALYTAGPVLALLVWWIISGRWKLDWLQKLAITGALSGFLAVGIIISTKIGGGGDLHNMDMFLMTLVFVTMLGLWKQVQGPGLKRWPAGALGLVIYLVLLPVYGFTPFAPGADFHHRLDLPKQADIDEALSTIKSEVAQASRNGEVLFMDQRQLLTFGYVRNVSFVPEYEKKYLMDQAMGGNAAYFQDYYQDLARERFSLIVSEPLKLKLKEEMGGPFTEENDAWVIWVAEPTLCFYEPIYTSRDVGVQLLVPRQDTASCEKYLQ